MKDFINFLYRNHSLAYKLILFISTTFLIVYLFPKSGKFKYNFEKGKPWQSENLYAPFDFAIKKTDEEIKAEKHEITAKANLYFNIESGVVERVISEYKSEFKLELTDSLVTKNKNKLYNIGLKIIDKLYNNGVLDEDYDFSADKKAILLDGRIEKQTVRFSDLVQQNDLKDIINNHLAKENVLQFQKPFIALFFEVIEPNLSYDKAFTEKALQSDLEKISFTRGSVEKGTLIISKGEVVEGDKYQKLKSLESEYESQVWTKSNYYWIVFAYTLLVSLALLMLLLFLRKYRNDIFENNTKVTFIFFNVFLMVFITTLVVNFNSQYIYVVPICILPLVLKAFFDARLGLFTHVITVLLLGSIVPNSYEYMFLQIIAGIVTILTVSELYKRANLFISVGQITLIYIIAYFAFFVIHEGSVETLKWETFGMFVLCGLATLFVQPLIYAYE